jgi:hypothetical protein
MMFFAYSVHFVSGETYTESQIHLVKEGYHEYINLFSREVHIFWHHANQGPQIMREWYLPPKSLVRVHPCEFPCFLVVRALFSLAAGSCEAFVEGEFSAATAEVVAAETAGSCDAARRRGQ